MEYRQMSCWLQLGLGFKRWTYLCTLSCPWNRDTVVQLWPQMRAMPLGLGDDGAMTRQPGRSWVPARQPGILEGADGTELPTYLAHSLWFCCLEGEKNTIVLKPLLGWSLFIFIMKIFKHIAKLKELDSGHPYGWILPLHYSLDSTTNIFLYISVLLHIYPYFYPPLCPSVLLTFWT